MSPLSTYSTKATWQRAAKYASVAPLEAEEGEKHHVVSRPRAVEKVKAKLGQSEFDHLQLQFKSAKTRGTPHELSHSAT